MAVSWKCVETLPSELEKTLKDLTDERWRVLSVVVPKPETCTIVAYKMQYEKGSRHREEQEEKCTDWDTEPTQ